MNIKDISLPEIYKSSADFRFFIKWIALCLSKVQYDTENLPDIYDPLRCPSELLWMLADTMGFKFDDRLPVAFNRLVLLYFMSMIRNRGSKDGVTLAAEVNLAQYNILDYGKEKDILYDRLEDTSIPVNSVSVTPHTAEGYIDVVYFTDQKPIDACIEYVRPLGMYMNLQAGVRYDANDRIRVDTRLSDSDDIGISIGSTHVGHYSRDDYASLQKVFGHPKYEYDEEEPPQIVHTNPYIKELHLNDPRSTYENNPPNIPEWGTMTKRERYKFIRENFMSKSYQVGNDSIYRYDWAGYYTNMDKRNSVYYRNSVYEESHGQFPYVQKYVKENGETVYIEIDPSYRALYSMQLCNNEHIVRSLSRKKELFGIGYGPQDGEPLPDDYEFSNDYGYGIMDLPKSWNLRYDVKLNRNQEQKDSEKAPDIYVMDSATSETDLTPMISPVMGSLGDSMPIAPESAKNSIPSYPEKIDTFIMSDASEIDNEPIIDEDGEIG